jgi:molybdopterin-guanine dinucleotide biosynthesis protein A
MGGRNKAMLPFHGETLISRQIRIMREVCEEILIVTHPDNEVQLMADQALVVFDAIRDQGPLGGIQAGLRASQHDISWVVACDEPFLSSQAAAYMAEKLVHEQADAIIPWRDGRHQMLHGVYRRHCVKGIDHLLAKEVYKVSALLKLIRWHKVEEEWFQSKGLELDFTLDVDTPEQYKQALDEENNKRGCEQDGGKISQEGDFS